ncbi:unnamed protein product [Musa acuminata subsp. malaccensis]|uniref:(wild Malaysian banana) hypothetical protein n=1 Tax=Musa acuminata subsp. malaccensis TaxID=214687 RepID=A0A804JSQ6_MUSAM|nr:PREDICTED: nonsense-mediated mRNA decay protein 2 [Musa acuminata subsp. malaccensis]CAG1855768.1 unnamed protein product [Musa acuminata subsp. malaccensis]
MEPSTVGVLSSSSVAVVMNTSQLTGDDAEELSSCDSGWTKYLSSPTHHDGGDDDDDDDDSEVEFTGGDDDDDDEHKGYDSEDSDDDSMASDASTGFIGSGVDGSKCNDVGDNMDGNGKEGHAQCSSSYSHEEFYEVEEARSKQACDPRSNSEARKNRFK